MIPETSATILVTAVTKIVAGFLGLIGPPVFPRNP